MDSRAEFEAWAVSTMKHFTGGLDFSLAMPTGHGGWTYATKAAESSWRAWQASRQALESEPVAWWDGDMSAAEDSFSFKWDRFYRIPVYTHPASRQSLDVKPFTWVFTDVNGKASEIAGDPVHRSPQDLRIYTALYTHPASADVPEEWRTTMKELADDLENEIEARRYGDLDRRIERDLIVVKEARVLLDDQEQPQ
jgi:hypothetical protein